MTNTAFKRVLATLAALLLTVGMVPLSVFAAGAEVYFAAPEPELYASAAGDSDAGRLLASLVSLEELEAYLRPRLINCEQTIDVSSFRIPADQQIGQALYYYIHYYLTDCFHYRTNSWWSSGGVMTKLEVEYYDFADTAEEYVTARAAYERAAETLLTGLKDNTALSDAEKALLLHDRLALWNEYDCESPITPASYSGYGALVRRVSVCQGYAFAYRDLLGRVGIDSGYASSDTLNHIWNVVYIDGAAYHVDVTWDDPVRDITGRVQHRYFLLSSEALYRTRAAEGAVATDFDQTPSSTRFDNAYWQSSRTAFQLADDALYYIDSEDAMLRRAEGTQHTDLLSVADTWRSSGGMWVGNFSRLSSDGSSLFYSLSDAVYKYDPVAGTSEVIWRPDLSIGSCFGVYGFMYEGGYLICDRNNSPNFDAGTRAQYQVRVPYDTQPPTAHIASTNAVAATQTVTLTLTDNAAIAGYYWGTDPLVSGNPYFATTAASATRTVTQPGTYYLTAKDAMGNLSRTQTITYYRTTLEADGGGVTPASVLTPAGASFALPTPARGGYTFKGWQAANGTVTNGVLTPTASGSCTAMWERLPAVVQAVEVVTPPRKTTYYRGDALDTAGLRLRLIYDYGNPTETTAFESVYGYDPDTPGTQTITVACAGKTTAFDVTVNTPTVTLSTAAKALGAGESAALTAQTAPEGLTVTWASSDAAIVSVENGTLTAHADGKVTVTASITYNGVTYTATCTVTVGCAHTTCPVVEARASTCRERGHEAYRQCADCGQLFSVDGTEMLDSVPYLPLAEHRFATEWTTSPEQHWHACVCGEQADTAAHTFVWVIDRAATEEEAGVQHEVCAICAFVRSEGTILPPSGHTHTLTHIPALDPTGETAGNIAYWTCEACGKCFADAEATREITRDETVLPPLVTVWGDVNGDGSIDTADAVLVLQYAANLIGQDGLYAEAADVNGDGAVDTADAVLILQRAAKLIDAFPRETA